MFGFGKTEIDASVLAKDLAVANMQFLRAGHSSEMDLWVNTLIQEGAHPDCLRLEAAACLSFSTWKGFHSQYNTGQFNEAVYAKFLHAFFKELDINISKAASDGLMQRQGDIDWPAWLDRRIAEYIRLCDSFADLALEINVILLLCSYVFETEPSVDTRNNLLHFYRHGTENAVELAKKWKIV